MTNITIIIIIMIISILLMLFLNDQYIESFNYIPAEFIPLESPLFKQVNNTICKQSPLTQNTCTSPSMLPNLPSICNTPTPNPPIDFPGKYPRIPICTPTPITICGNRCSNSNLPLSPDQINIFSNFNWSESVPKCSRRCLSNNQIIRPYV